MVNKAIIVGYLGQDPEVRYTQNGTAVCNLSVATSKRYKDQSGQQVDKTEWHRIVAWQRLAENCGEYLRKGSMVFVEGELETRQWQDKDGNDRWTTEIVARVIQFLDRKGDTPNQSGGQRKQSKSSEPQGQNYDKPESDDDLPF